MVQIRNAATTLQNVVTYDVVLRVKNPELKLKPGMTANVAVIIEEKEGVLKVPNAALRFKPSPAPEPKKQKKGPLVWMAGPENKAIPVPVKPGLTDGQATEITGSRLKEGDRVHLPRWSRIRIRRRKTIGPGARGCKVEGTYLIQVEELAKVYRVGDIEIPALNQVTLAIEAGEFVSIMGSSGSGKSTFMNILGCLDVPSAGRSIT